MCCGPPGMVRDLIVGIVWLLPPMRVKNRLLNLLGNQIDPTATLWPTVVISCGRFEIGEGATLMPLNIFSGMSLVEIGPSGFVGRLNQVVADRDQPQSGDSAGVLAIGRSGGMTNRHYLNCSGRVELGERSAIGGVRSVFETRDIDIDGRRHGLAGTSLGDALVGEIVIGEFSMVGASCIVTSGARIPSRSVVGMGSVVVPPASREAARSGLYAGAPAHWIRDLPDCEWWSRDSEHTTPSGPGDFDADLGPEHDEQE